MRVSRLLIAVALVGSTLALGLPAAKAGLIVNSWLQQTIAGDGVGSNIGVVDTTVSNPFSATRTAIDDADGPGGAAGSSSTTIYDFVWNAAGGSFNWDFGHQRNGTLNSLAMATGSSLNFTVTGADMLYDLSGLYSMTGGQRIVGEVVLRDQTAGNTAVFDWLQQSFVTNNESFVVAQSGGDFTDTLLGSPSGTLLATHTYQMHYQFFIQGAPNADSGATAVGDFHMNITPEPATLSLLAFGGLVLLRRRR